MANKKYTLAGFEQLEDNPETTIKTSMASFVDKPINLDGGIYNSEKKLSDISIDLLRTHPNNIFSMDGIKQLIFSIEHRGQLNAIEVYPNDDGTYTINAGHRRVVAFNQLRNKYIKLYEETKNKEYAELVDRYTYIRAYILDDEEQKDAVARFLDSNYQNRQNDFQTAINHIEHLSQQLDDDSKEVLEMAFSDGDFDPKFSSNRIKVISKIMTDVFCIKNASETTIARYLSIRSKGSPELLEAVKASKMAVSTAWDINRQFSTEQQSVLLQTLEEGRDAFEEKLKVMKKTLQKKKAKKPVSLKAVDTLNKSISKLVSDEADRNELKDLFSKITEIAKRYI
jgi:hypothetical protein